VDFPESTFPHQGLADIYFSQGDFVGAIREGQLAAKLSPDNVELAYRMIGPMLQLGLTDIVRSKSDDPAWQEAYEFYFENILIFEKNYKTLFERMDFKVAANPDDYWVAFEAGWYNAMFGDKQHGITLLIENTSSLSQTDMFGMPHCSPAIEIAWAYKESDDVRSDSLIEKCRLLMKEQSQSSVVYFELDYLAARINALENNPEQALKALSRAIDKGWREWWTKHDPLLANLRGNPEYQKLVQFIDDDLATQKVEALALFAEE
jgi:tetratricopeptide (TPR) repeat protein